MSTTITERGLKVRLLTDKLFFDSGSAVINAGALPTLGKIGGIIATEAKHPVEVEGHTDDRPIATSQFPSNWQLSGARAGAVVQRLIGAGVSGGRVSLAGYAAQHPVASNATRGRSGTEPPGGDHPHPAAWSNPVAWRRHPMNKKIIIAVVALVAAGGAYKTVLAKPKAKAKKPNVEGTLYVLQKEFLVNLADERYAKISAALLLNPKDHSAAAAGGHGAAQPPEGYGAMSQEAVIRSIITDVFTGLPADDLEDTKKRDEAPQGDPAPHPRGVRRARRRRPVPRPDGPVRP